MILPLSSPAVAVDAESPSPGSIRGLVLTFESHQRDRAIE